MHVKSFAAILVAFMLGSTGCHLAGSGGCGAGGCDGGPMLGGCASGTCSSSGFGGGCPSGNCGGGLLGMLGHGLGGGGAMADPANCVTPETLTQDGYGVRGGMTGPLASLVGKHHRGPQSHMGQYPGPADGPPTPATTYPYYTTRAPRDFFLANPSSIGP